MKFALIVSACLALTATTFAAPCHTAPAPPASGSGSGPAPAPPAQGSLHKANHIVPNCNKFYTVVASDGCDSVATKNGITQAQLFSWNKGLHHSEEHSCDNLDTGKAYCVGVSN